MARKKAKRTESLAETSPPPKAQGDVSTQEALAAQEHPAFPVVGIGASAGGLDALKELLQALPTDTGMAFVVVQHLDPTHSSMLSEILSRATKMPVTEVKDEPAVEPNHVYVLPPNRNMIINKGVLSLAARTEARGQHRPIDSFFRSLAEDQKHKSIGVVLSGSGTDGTVGLEEIKAEGGITFAQDESAQYEGMPRSAVDAGCVDFVLPPGRIAEEIARIGRHPYVAPAAKPEKPPADDTLSRTMRMLRNATGVDFTHYKQSTLYRRLTRRMVLHKMESLKEYVRFLEKHPAELDLLFQDILINVTSFFRNPEAFEALKEKVFPELAKDRSRHEALRLWVLGCSTGEESYSVAMAFVEFAQATGCHIPIQIFASDLNGAGIEKARAGLYSKNIVADVAPDRLRRFFVQQPEGSYRVSKQIRDMCVFARHNVLTDPPFSRLDLITCRNLLIYLEPVLQEKVLPLLHYALRNHGFLWLGNSEAIGPYRELFEPVEPRYKIYAKKSASAPSHAGFLHEGVTVAQDELGRKGGRAQEPAIRGLDTLREADRILLAKYAPAGVLVNSSLEILQFRGDTSPYLAPAPGKASLNLVKMAREGLLVGLRGALHKARREEARVREEGLQVKSNGGYRNVNVEVIPVRASSLKESCLLVVFEEAAPRNKAEGKIKTAPARDRSAERADEEGADRQVDRLAQELAATREYLQSVIEQQEAANEELQSANEEVQSANEELQSINEELETSKEEIQSSNEELNTLNDELQNRNLELTRSNNDFINLLNSVQMAIVMLGPDLRIRRFTPAAEKMFNLIPADVGRPVTDIKLNINVPDLEQLLVQVVDSVTVKELEVQDREGRWYSLRIRPYKTLENKIDGAVLVLVDVDVLKRDQETLARQADALSEADRRKNEFLGMLAHELRNPLAPLRNAAEILKSPEADKPHIQEAQEMLGRQLHTMTRLVDDLLDASRISERKLRLRTERLELQSVIHRAVATMRPQLQASGQEVSVSLPQEPVYVQGDATRLEQIFWNLLHNAAKFTFKDGHISVSAELKTSEGSARKERARPDASPHEIAVRVKDDGIGMPPDLLPHVFELFTQGERSLDRAYGGLGIGLTLVKNLVELHGGSVEAHSDGAGQGAEFVVRLPVLSIAAGPARKARKKAVPAPHVKRRILVVDDNIDAADSLATVLRLSGHEVQVGYEGPAALNLAQEFRPQIVLLDIGLPKMDGYEVARRLRQMPDLEKTSLVAITGYGQDDDRKSSHEAGFDHHLIKPVQFERLQSIMQSLGEGEGGGK
jgi:two-component system CheB/CheR fusion protein